MAPTTRFDPPTSSFPSSDLGPARTSARGAGRAGTAGPLSDGTAPRSTLDRLHVGRDLLQAAEELLGTLEMRTLTLLLQPQRPDADCRYREHDDEINHAFPLQTVVCLLDCPAPVFPAWRPLSPEGSREPPQPSFRSFAAGERFPPFQARAERRRRAIPAAAAPSRPTAPAAPLVRSLRLTRRRPKRT